MKITKITFEEYAKQIQKWYEDAEKWREIEPRIVKPKWVKSTVNENKEIVERLKKYYEEKHTVGVHSLTTIELCEELQKILYGVGDLSGIYSEGEEK